MASNGTNFEQFLQDFIKALNKSNINYVLIGGLAVNYYGRPRSTLDADIIIENDFVKIRELQKCLIDNNFLVAEDEIVDAVKEGNHCSIFWNKDILLRLDIKVPTRLLEEEALINKRKTSVFGLDLFIQIPEEIITAKLIYGSDQDHDDAYGMILRLKDQLDYQLLEKLAKREKVFDKLSSLLEESKQFYNKE